MDTKAEVTLDKVGEGFEITKVALTLVARVPGATEEQFQEAAAQAKANCPVSKLFKGAEITLSATLQA